MMKLINAPNLTEPDDFYEALIDAHRELPIDESHALNARLVLLLANHIGDLDTLREALTAARAGAEAAPAVNPPPPAMPSPPPPPGPLPAR